MFYKKGVLKNSQNSEENTWAGDAFKIKLQDLQRYCKRGSGKITSDSTGFAPTTT